MQNECDLIIKSRSKAQITGASGIISFNENEAVFSTELGCLAIAGTKLTVDNFDRQNGVITVSGSINAAFYPLSKQNKSEDGLFKRMFGKR